MKDKDDNKLKGDSRVEAKKLLFKRSNKERNNLSWILSAAIDAVVLGSVITGIVYFLQGEVTGKSHGTWHAPFIQNTMNQSALLRPNPTSFVNIRDGFGLLRLVDADLLVADLGTDWVVSTLPYVAVTNTFKEQVSIKIHKASKESGFPEHPFFIKRQGNTRLAMFKENFVHVERYLYIPDTGWLVIGDSITFVKDSGEAYEKE